MIDPATRLKRRLTTAGLALALAALAAAGALLGGGLDATGWALLAVAFALVVLAAASLWGFVREAKDAGAPRRRD